MKDINSKIIDGQELFFLNFEEWNNYVEKEQIKQSAIYPKLKKDIHLMQSYQELQLTIGHIRKLKIPYMLLYVNSKWQRISIEHREYKFCKWSGLVGLPNSIDTYIGIPKEFNAFELMKEAKEIETKNCPKCENTFIDFVIWTEKI
jgi:hypothetical protein